MYMSFPDYPKTNFSKTQMYLLFLRYLFKTRKWTSQDSGFDIQYWLWGSCVFHFSLLIGPRSFLTSFVLEFIFILRSAKRDKNGLRDDFEGYKRKSLSNVCRLMIHSSSRYIALFHCKRKKYRLIKAPHFGEQGNGTRKAILQVQKLHSNLLEWPNL